MTRQKSYAVTNMRNSQTQCQRGKLRGYAVTQLRKTLIHVRVCRCACMHAGGCVCAMGA